MEIDGDEKLDAALIGLYLRRQSILRRLLKETAPTNRKTDSRSTVFTPEQYAVISALDAYGHGVTVKEIAEAITTPHANVTRTLERLEKKGLVYRTRGSNDRRQVIVRLTLAGTKLARQFHDITERLHERLWGVYTSDETRVLLKLLSKP